MIDATTTKLELDLMQANEMDNGFQLASQHHLPAVVVHPQLMAQALTLRAKRRGRFKIITTIDWPKGEAYGMLKLRGITSEVMEADGFEIMLTPNKNDAEIKNEAKLLTSFLKSHISQFAEVRFVLGCLVRPFEEIIRTCAVLRGIPAPSIIRTDHHIKAQVSKANLKMHSGRLMDIRKEIAHPLKVSGNIDSLKVIAGLQSTSGLTGTIRFAVNLMQLKNIIKDIQKQQSNQPQPSKLPLTT